MRFVDRRSGWAVEGKFIAILKPGVVPTDDEMLAYYDLKPGDNRFADLARATKYARIVLLKHNGNFVVAPLNPDVSEITA